MKYGPSLADPVAKTSKRGTYVLDSSAASSHGYVEIDLGDIIVPEGGALGGVAIEIWARRVTGTGDAFLNFIRLLPSTPGKDELTRIVLPGSSAEQWLGSELASPPYKLTADPTWVAGAISGSFLILDAINEGGGAPPNTGTPWPAGRHRLAFTYQAQAGGLASIRVRVVSVGGGGAGSLVASTTWGHGAGQGNVVTRVLEFDSQPGTSYQPQIVVIDMSSAKTFTVHSISHEFTPALLQGEKFHTDPDNQVVHRQDSAGALLSELETEGEVPFDSVSPGPTAVFAIPLDIPRPGYAESESVKGRTLALTAVGPPATVG
jgi:hypothetical protein